MFIPKIIHIAWKSKDVLRSMHPLIVNGLLQLRVLNPDWEIQISDDTDIDTYLKNNLSQEEFRLVKNDGIVQKSDLWRLIKIYNEGGLYVDIDRLCNKPLSFLIDNDTKWVLPVCAYKDFSHDFMMSAPGNPVFKNTINLYLNRRLEGINNTYFLGVQTYMHAITHTVFNKIIDVHPGEDNFKDIINELVPYKFIKIIPEFPPGNTAIYEGELSFDTWATIKKSFYKENNIKHWTGEW